ALMRHPGWVVTRNELMNAARGPSVTISDRTIDSHIRNVRRKFAAVGGQQVIETRPGVGYKLGDC
ncbi:MAG: winged helix-turn-helix domain-containing protein, partial [Deltaproteobacteria bacterium]